MLCALPLIVALFITPPPAATQPERPAIEQAIEMLTAEARQAQLDMKMPTDVPDFARRFDREIPAEALTEAIRSRADEHPFIDAYIRWQLTSFDPPLGEFDQQQFIRFMQEAPTLLDNPFASMRALRYFGAVAEAGPMPPGDVELVQTQLAETQRVAHQVDEFGVAAVGFREWVLEALRGRRPWREQWLLAWCNDTVRAGWAPQTLKSRITRELGTAAGDASFTPEQRRSVAELAQQMAGTSRRFVRGVNILASGEVKVSMSEASIDQEDVDRWVERLRGN